MIEKFCILPFVQLEIQPNGNIFVCCHSNTPEILGNLHEENLEEIWNGPKVKAFQDKFLSGKYDQISHCKDCFYYEQHNMESWRTKENKNWAKYLEEINSGKEVKLKFPKSLSIRISNLCNFSCRSCKPSTSTAWFADAKFLNPKGNYKKLNCTPADNPLSKQLAPYWSEIEHLYFAGGEPLLEKDHYLIIDEVIKYNKSIMINYDTNFSILEFGKWNVLDQWNQLESVVVSGSIDGFGPVGEYIRKGLDWPLYIKNWNRIKNECPNVRLKSNFTLSIYNMFHVLDFIEEMQRIELFNGLNEHDFEISLVEEPSWMSLQALPLEVKKEVEFRYKNFMKNNSFGRINQDLQSALNYMMAEDKSHQLGALKGFTKKLDLLRSEDFNELFREESQILFGSI
ncbi:twitch domain-containing radical SAM protein [Halobacteriovorax sp. HLS]|uniref:twitch domain-containing radical SAM protein n=1 Tax=Halobacteriovorax sp. HLS TaxID=2234000 RepID=UPI0013E3C3AF|nr:twitch domain-containing radical SAM protein [Halobacteriovorax sp. HLS]